MQTTCNLPSKQALCTRLDSSRVFELINEDRFKQAANEHLPAHRNRRYPPTETLAMFVAQVLNDDSSCQHAVNDLIVRCAQQGVPEPGISTAGYCEARKRLPTPWVEALYKIVGQQISQSALPDWLWRNRRVYLIDGTGVSMPDTVDNQRHYPQPSSQQPGIGFPEARLVALSCAATGAIVDAALGPAKGKSTGELSQMRLLARTLSAGDVLVGDALYDTYWSFAMLQEIGCDGVFEINGNRARPEKRRSLLTLKRPARPQWMDEEAYELCPRKISVRQVICRKRGHDQ